MSDNLNQENTSFLESVDRISKKVFENATTSEIALTPDAYKVWYEYFKGLNKHLIAEIKDLVISKEKFEPAIHQALFKKHFAPPDSHDIEEVHHETQAMISKIFTEMLQATKNTTEFNDKIQEYSLKVHDATKVSDLRQTIKNMLKDTAEIVASNKHLSEKLNEATQQTEKLKEKIQITEKEATVDALTGLNNRKAFDKKINELYREFELSGAIFSAIFADVDFFKKFNDTYGHKVGDLVLQEVAKILKQGVKGGDFPARYGGEEFVVLLPTTSLDGARIVSEQLRIHIASKKPYNKKTGEVFSKITASFGVAEMKTGDTPESIMVRADKALYLAKESGRNKVTTESELEEGK
jgi:diguanylate cyclase